MNIYLRCIATALFLFPANHTIADHVRIEYWEANKLVDKIPDPNQCDLATAHVADPMRTVQNGVDFDDIEPISAFGYCQKWTDEVVAKYKDKKPSSDAEIRELRAIYQMSRIMSHRGNDETAYNLNLYAANRGYPYSSYYLYLAYVNGWGTPKDEINALVYLQRSIDLKIPVAFQRRAFVETKEAIPDFEQIESDLFFAENGGRDVTTNWAQLHERRGEYYLNQSIICHDDNCGKAIEAMSDTELNIKYGYQSLRNYQMQISAAHQLYQDYLTTHPNNKTAENNLLRLNGLIDKIDSAAHNQLHGKYR